MNKIVFHMAGGGPESEILELSQQDIETIQRRAKDHPPERHAPCNMDSPCSRGVVSRAVLGMVVREARNVALPEA